VGGGSLQLLHLTSAQTVVLLYVRRILPRCRFEVVEAAAGAPKLFAASIPVGKTGPQVTAISLYPSSPAVALPLLKHTPALHCMSSSMRCRVNAGNALHDATQRTLAL
jgi:hypothetical protein